MRLRARWRWVVAGAATAALVVPVGWSWQASLLPDEYDMAAMGYADWGGGPVGEPGAHGAHGPSGVPVAELTETAAGPADVRETFTVQTASAGRFTVNGQTPGPLLEARVGDLVEVTLVNDDVEEGVTLHWHGVGVPNAADGVAGVTQDAVLPGQSHVYRFVADQAGSFWYHSHQLSHEQVRRGLLGPLVVHEERPDPAVVDQVALLHAYGDGPTLNGEPGVSELDVAPGQRVRLRVVNTDNGLATVWVTGAAFEVTAVDATDVNDPSPVEDRAVRVPAGGRVDLGLEVPAGGVRVDFGGTTSLVLGRDPTGGAATLPPTEVVDLLTYGRPTDLGLDPTDPDRVFDYRIGKRPGFLDGRPGMWWSINGHLFPDVAMFMVEEGDVVVVRIENGSDDAHPMHLHGHHAVVLSRDGVPATGSPWWVDSLEVGTGETFEIAFVADNPGLWMDHCHNLPHAAQGLVSHLMYAGVVSSYRVGGGPGNQPE
ncbi:Multicopper oxidase mco [Nocardioides dokdonensis FR1436]|uniref:Multicopper oxidase mco n=1 Tax=Nocardioides dokdonensis FR1436 TaxID=1300347 RepID=A0A1A9GKB0_9ACTN|nr:multicopper oxidase family protein [Nocardioides dokdonensis]ANH38704.1 Multicopper oxidase mco [Nocardioides dokdonensis FR1436]